MVKVPQGVGVTWQKVPAGRGEVEGGGSHQTLRSPVAVPSAVRSPGKPSSCMGAHPTTAGLSGRTLSQNLQKSFRLEKSQIPQRCLSAVCPHSVQPHHSPSMHCLCRLPAPAGEEQLERAVADTQHAGPRDSPPGSTRRQAKPSSASWGPTHSHLVEALATDVAHGLLDALGEGLPCPLHIDRGGNPKDHLALVAGRLAPLHELRNGPVRKRDSGGYKLSFKLMLPSGLNTNKKVEVQHWRNSGREKGDFPGGCPRGHSLQGQLAFLGRSSPPRIVQLFPSLQRSTHHTTEWSCVARVWKETKKLEDLELLLH